MVPRRRAIGQFFSSVVNRCDLYSYTVDGCRDCTGRERWGGSPVNPFDLPTSTPTHKTRIRTDYPLERVRGQRHIPGERSMTTEPRAALTKKQQAIYNFIRKHIEEKGFPPAIRDICTEFGISSPNGVMCHLKALESKGYINRVQKHKYQQRAQARGITIPSVPAGRNNLRLEGGRAAG